MSPVVFLRRVFRRTRGTSGASRSVVFTVTRTHTHTCQVAVAVLNESRRYSPRHGAGGLRSRAFPLPFPVLVFFSRDEGSVDAPHGCVLMLFSRKEPGWGNNLFVRLTWPLRVLTGRRCDAGHEHRTAHTLSPPLLPILLSPPAAAGSRGRRVPNSGPLLVRFRPPPSIREYGTRLSLVPPLMRVAGRRHDFCRQTPFSSSALFRSVSFTLDFSILFLSPSSPSNPARLRVRRCAHAIPRASIVS